MAIKNYHPTSAGMRFRTGLVFDEITKKRPEKGLSQALKHSGGRNNNGRITADHRGGGHKRLYRLIDFKRDKKNIQPGNCLPLKFIPVGTVVHNIELKIGKGGQLVRSAGSGAQLMAKEGSYALLKMPSGELRYVLSECRATVGQVGNADQENISWGKAGRMRWLGWRPGSRGIAKNPVDHPHGGGEGRSKGNHPMTPWGKPTKGYKTRKNHSSDKYIVKGRKAK